MGEAHEEGAGVLDLCNANGLRLSTPSRARSAPCASAAWRAFRLHTPYFRKFFLPCPPRRPMFYPYNTKFKAPNRNTIVGTAGETGCGSATGGRRTAVPALGCSGYLFS